MGGSAGEVAATAVRRTGNTRAVTSTDRGNAAELGNLPAPVAALVGREREIAAVELLMRDQRLVTLAGAGGIGKTTLALEVARRSAKLYSDGAWLIELAPLPASAALPSVVLGSLKLRRRPGPTALASLVDTLAERELLLVLDNCEHLVEAAAELVSTLLQRCPSLRVLTTSREVLNMTGEAVFSVPPMEIPQRAIVATIDAIKGLEAIQLFLVRASAVRPGFELTEQNRKAVVQICRRLDGIPLAIELAAVRTRGLPVDVIADRLSQRFDLLTSKSRNASPRHRTLRATLDWSHDLLSDGEQRLFRQLAVFRGGFTLDAAEQICRDGAGATESQGISDELTDLIDKSLVVLEEAHDQPSRFRLLEPLREYGEARLRAVGEADSLEERHASYYIELADSALRGRTGVDAQWFSWAATELDNLRAAFEWAVRHEPHVALRLALSLKRHWMLREGGEGRVWLQRALTMSEIRDELRADALCTESFWSVFNGAVDQARPLADEAFALATELGSRIHEGYALHAMALIENAADSDRSSGRCFTYFGEAEQVIRESGDRWSLSLLLNNYGFILYERGHLATALEKLHEAVAIAEELGDLQLSASNHGSLGDALLAAGFRAEAEGSYRTELEQASTFGQYLAASEGLAGLAWFAVEAGGLERALVLLGAASEFSRRVGARIYSVNVTLVDNARAKGVEALGVRRAERAWERGAAMSLPEARRFAFADDTEAGGPERESVLADAAQPALAGNVMLREGDYWTLGFGGRVTRIKDSKGLRDLAKLLSRPGTQIGCFELAFAGSGRSTNLADRRAAEENLGIQGGVGPLLDAEAREEYRARLLELEVDIESAEADNNSELASQLRLEREFILRELKSALGLGGRARQALDPAERARKAVAGRIREAIGHVEALHPDLGTHLRYSIRTGAYCSYVPLTPTEWRFEADVKTDQ